MATAEQEYRGLDQPTATSAVPSDGAHTTQPERGLEPGDSNLIGAKPAAEKQGIADKVKGLLGGVMKGRHDRAGSGSGSGVGSGVGHSSESTPHGTAAHANEYTGHTLDPTAVPAGSNFDQKKGSSGSSPGPWPHPTNPRAHTGHTNAHGGATLSDEHGNLHPGPESDSVKKEGFISKIMDKLHSPRSPKTQH